MNRSTVSSLPAYPAFDDGAATSQREALAGYLGKIAAWLSVGFVVMITFDGALRYYLAAAGAPWAVYAKDGLLVALTLLGTVRLALTDLRNAAFVAILSFLGIGFVVGVLTLHDLRQPLFELKAILPLLGGAVMAPVVQQHARLFRRVFFGVWCAAVGGIVLTYCWRAPWVGFVYDVAGTTIAASREWSLGEAERVAGFSRASFDVALQCLCFSAVIAALSRAYVVGLAVWLVSAGAVYLTLSRSAIVALGVAVVLHALVFATRGTQRVAKIAVIALAVAVVALPFAAKDYYQNKAGRSDTSDVTSTSSFEDRAVRTWPDAFSLVSKRGNWLVGRGLGGIGVAQQFFEPDRFNPGDNLFVYLWGALGSLGTLFFAFMAWCAWRAPTPLSRTSRAGILITGTLFAVGLALNVVEAAVAAFCLGLALGWLRDRSTDRSIE